MKTYQRKIIRYVQSGSLLKLKSLLEKHNNPKKPKLNLNFKIGHKQRTPLHVACLLGDDAVVRSLLYHGASPAVVDDSGDTPAHLAAQFFCDDGNYADYKLLIEPLVKRNADITTLKNKNGETPSEILHKAKKKYKLLNKLIQEEQAVEEDKKQGKDEGKNSWYEKLANEMESEYLEKNGESSFSHKASLFKEEDEYQTYDQWADRINKEYSRKHRDFQNKKRHKEDQSRKRKEQMSDLHSHLMKDQDDYIKQVKRMKTEVLNQKRERYEKKMTSLKDAETDKLRFRDIPWPCQGNAKEMVEVLLSGILSDSSEGDQKRVIMRQLVLWHPDKFEQRCGDKLLEKDRQRILDTVKAIAQELNKYLEDLKSRN